jgi:hypothetical protein
MAITDIFINFVFNKKNVEKGINEIKEDFKGIGGAVAKGLGVPKLGLISGVAGAIYGLKQVYNILGDVGNMADKFSLPVETVSKFSNLMSLVGANTNEALASFEKLQGGIVDFHTTGEGWIRDFSSTFAVSMDNVKTTDGLLNSLRNTYKTLQNDDQRAKFNMIVGDEKLLRLVHMQNDEYDKAINKRGGMRTITAEQVKGARDLDIALAQLKNAGVGLGATFMPLLKYVSILLNGVVEGFSVLTNSIGDVLGALVGGLKELMTLTSDVLGALAGGLKSIFEPFKYVLGGGLKDDVTNFFTGKNDKSKAKDGNSFKQLDNKAPIDNPFINMMFNNEGNNQSKAIDGNSFKQTAINKPLSTLDGNPLKNMLLQPSSTSQSTINDNSTITINVNGSTTPQQTGQEVLKQVNNFKGLSNRGVQFQ